MPQAKPYCATVTVGVAMKCYNAAELFALYNDPARLQPRDLYAFTATLPVLDEVTLVRARSTRSQMGMGLFTTRPFACNQPITYYSGARATRSEVTMLRETDPSIKDYQAGLGLLDYFILGNYTRDADGAFNKVPYASLSRIFHNQGAGQFCNHSRAQQNAALVAVADMRWNVPPNADLFDTLDEMRIDYPQGQGRGCIVVALRNIEAGEEIFVSYGTGYTPPKTALATCAACGSDRPAFACSVCHTELYCDSICQRAEQLTHACRVAGAAIVEQ